MTEGQEREKKNERERKNQRESESFPERTGS